MTLVPPDPLCSLDGHWEMVRARCRGEDAPALVVQQTRLEITGGRYRVSFNGAAVDEGRMQPASGLPQNMVFRSLAGEHAGRTLPAMYQLVGHRLRICYGLDGASPSSFSAEAGEDQYLATYKRSA
jgi:uncharacterized protein (TIGR03067 family)